MQGIRKNKMKWVGRRKKRVKSRVREKRQLIVDFLVYCHSLLWSGENTGRLREQHLYWQGFSLKKFPTEFGTKNKNSADFKHNAGDHFKFQQSGGSQLSAVFRNILLFLLFYICSNQYV